MRRLLSAARRAAQDENWYGALAIALTLPDIAGKVDEPRAKSWSRYVAWCETYLESKYIQGESGRCLLLGGDVYALRCAFLHEGSSNTSRQAAHRAYRAFRFVYPPGNGNVVHCNRVGDRLQLQVDVFCDDLFDAVGAWLAEAEADPAKRRRLDSQMRLELPGRELQL